MNRKEMVAMLLAGGEGSRLGNLTKWIAKPAVPFGGKYRIIDFTLSNCSNSGIDTVGVLTQYQPLILHSYLGVGTPWDLNRKRGGLKILPPFVQKEGGRWYKGTANAIYENITFIEQYDPEYVLIISGDHIYKMDYTKMLDSHKKNNADVTISVTPVPWEETSRFGIMNTDENLKIQEFEEKPTNPKSNLASMGVYIFNWHTLKRYLLDNEKKTLSNDFGKDIIPAMLKDHCSLQAYPFEGYWKDVGTIDSLWQANLDLLDDVGLNLHECNWRIRSVEPNMPPQYIGSDAIVRNSMVGEGSTVMGEINHSILFYDVQVNSGSLVEDAIVMPHTKIGKNTTIRRCIIGEGMIIPDGVTIGNKEGPIQLIDQSTNPEQAYNSSAN
ncbi:glucose-1-phosphate adenylyltransferase [Aquibacillus rhizosphaerae]|uniref:Glucose-1-phosphate adenylyltransferase n=1 Tax=Aquibacillus rhizosphaerae TaxID=3051431 RepID=A0ABT7L1B5_9BACI|nr:glucose-1-phosphate adenylyltransferase [Aquibacillus sp. LR5S19]MDL4839637.1 glucose-1-phosphate adenylyltransferase [Aquibacillus sp. LR5S19]